MTRTAYIFMDFDGVTHPWGEVEDFRCLPRIEAVVREFPEARIVIASDWRMLFSMQKLMARFSEDVRPQIARATTLPSTIYATTSGCAAHSSASAASSTNGPAAGPHSSTSERDDQRWA